MQRAILFARPPNISCLFSMTCFHSCCVHLSAGPHLCPTPNHVQHGVMPPLLVYCSSGFTFSWKQSLLSPSIGQTKPSPLLCVIQASQGPFPSSDLEPRISHGFFYCFGPKQLSFVTHPLGIQDLLFSPKPYCSL